MATRYSVNDRIKLYDGGDAIIKFVGKTRLDDTLWFGIEYLSSLISPFKPTLITSADIKSRKSKSKLSKTSTPKRIRTSKTHKKTSSSILYTTNYKKPSKSSKKLRSTLNPLDSASTSDLNRATFKKQITASLKSKSSKKKQKNSRSSSMPSKEIKVHLHSMDTMDINNTLALSHDLDSIASTIDFPDEDISKKDKYKIKKKKRRKNYHSDIRDSILSSPSLKKKNISKKHKSKNKNVPTLSMNVGIEHGLNINFDKKYKNKAKKTDNILSLNPIFNESKTNGNHTGIDKLQYDNNNVKPMSPSRSTNIEFAALIEDENIILNEGKEIENDIGFQQQYSNIFTSIKSDTGISKSLALTELKKSVKKKEDGRKRGLSAGVKAVLNGEKKNGKKHRSVKKQKSVGNDGYGSLKKLKLNRIDSKNKNKVNENIKEDVMD